MTEVFERVKTDASGDVIELVHTQAVHLRPMSTEIIPAGLPQGSEAYIIDKCATAFCGGDGYWYHDTDTPIAPGQPWSVMF